jgi:hypothetical protein
MDMLYKSCRVFNKEFKKMKFVFSIFSTIFYVFSKIQLKLNTI